MTSQETSDITRGVDALRRAWWVPVLAAVVGAALALSTGARDESATFESVVSTPALDPEVLPGVTTTPPVDVLALRLQSPDTAADLGESGTGVAVSATVAVDKASVSVRGTAASVATARRGTEAYAARFAESYQDFVATQAEGVLDSLDAGIAALEPAEGAPTPGGPANASTLAKLKVQRELVANLAAAQPETPDVREISSGSSPAPGALLLALAFGLLAVGVVALAGLSRRRLRYRDDVERVTGEGTLFSEVSLSGRASGAGQVLSRLGGAGPVTLVPVGQLPLDDVRTDLVGGSPVEVVLAEPLARTQRQVTTDGPTVLVVRLGVDKTSELDLAYREFSSAAGTFAGVVAVAHPSRRSS